MAHFYSEIQGIYRGLASRMGTENSGIWGHIRGWNVGVEVVGGVDSEGNDVFTVYATGGSNGRESNKIIAYISTDDNGNVVSGMPEYGK